MSLVVAGQIAGMAFACGLNLYATIGVLGILSRLGMGPALPTGLQGLEGALVIASALALFLIEAVIDKIHHADSLWDTVHTFIRPPAAVLLAVSALWDQGAAVILVGAALAGAVALTAHGSKAGLRLALNATMHTRTQTWVSVAEDVLAIGFAACALFFPLPTLAVTTAMVALSILVGPRLWRAFYLGLRSLAAWLRSIFEPSSWREADRLPGYVRAALGEEPMGSAPHRGVRAALLHVPGIGSFRNGWLVVTAHGPVFVFRSVRGTRVAELPPPRNVQAEPGVWAHRLHIRADHDSEYTIFMLKDGPDMEVASETLSHATP